jgi:DUF3096 family protein
VRLCTAHLALDQHGHMPAQSPFADEHKGPEFAATTCDTHQILRRERIALRHERRYCLRGMERPTDRSLSELRQLASQFFCDRLDAVVHRRLFTAGIQERRSDSLSAGHEFASGVAARVSPSGDRVSRLSITGPRSLAADDVSLLKPGFSLLFRSQNGVFRQYLLRVGWCASDRPMCADVQITFRRASNIPSRERQMTGARGCPDGVGTLRSGREVSMNLHLTIGPIVSLVAGILILMMPRLLNYIVAIYLIIIGLLGLFGAGSFHLK